MLIRIDQLLLSIDIINLQRNCIHKKRARLVQDGGIHTSLTEGDLKRISKTGHRGGHETESITQSKRTYNRGIIGNVRDGLIESQPFLVTSLSRLLIKFLLGSTCSGSAFICLLAQLVLVGNNSLSVSLIFIHTIRYLQLTKMLRCYCESLRLTKTIVEGFVVGVIVA